MKYLEMLDEKIQEATKDFEEEKEKAIEELRKTSLFDCLDACGDIVHNKHMDKMTILTKRIKDLHEAKRMYMYCQNNNQK